MENKSQREDDKFQWQKQAVEFILKKFSSHTNVLCTKKMGGGKTMVGCKVLESLLPEIKAQKSYALILCPTNEIINDSWKETLSYLQIDSVVLSNKNFDNYLLSDGSFYPIGERVYLLTYKMLSSFCKKTKKHKVSCFIKKVPYFIVFDEIHNLTNNKDKKNKLTREIVKHLPNCKRLGLTATPTVNDIAETKLYRYILNPHYDDDEELFLDEFHFDGDANVEHPESASHQFIIDLPLREDEQKAIKDYNTNNVGNAAFVSNLLLIGQYKTATISVRPTTKLLAVKKIIETLPLGDKLIVLDKYTKTLEYISIQEWIRPFYPILYHGKISKKKREEYIKQFDEDDKYRILLGTKQIAGEGLNLQIANHILVLSLDWTPKDINQITGRIKRAEQKKEIFCYFLTCNRKKNENSFSNKNDAARLQTIERKAIAQKEFSATNELSNYKRIAFSNSKTFEAGFATWLESVLAEYKEIKRRNTVILKTIAIMNEIAVLNSDKKYILLLCDRIKILLETYDLKTSWENIEKICNGYMQADSDILTLQYHTISNEGSLRKFLELLESVSNTELNL